VGPGDSGGGWIFSGDGGPLTPVTSNRNGRFYEVYPPTGINNSGAVVFEAGLLLNGQTNGGPGFFAGQQDPVTAIMVTSAFDPTSPFRSPLVDLRPSINNFGAVAFTATTAVGRGVFVNEGGAISTIADSSTYQEMLYPVINDQYQVVFYGNTGQGSTGIFAGPNPDADKVATGVGTSLNNAGQIAFIGALPDGTPAVLRADPCHERRSRGCRPQSLTP